MELWTLRVKAIRDEASDTKTIQLQRVGNEPFDYQPGQFLTLIFDHHGHELRRSYSFSTTPDIDPDPAITVKRVPNGEISRFILDHLRVGDTLTSLPPAGRFVLGDDDSPLCFIAAGSGLVPIFSLLKKALTTNAHTILITQQHEPASTPFRNQLTALQAAYGQQKLVWIDLLSIQNGRINNWWLERWLLTTGVLDHKTRFYICGPPAFMRMARFTLRTLGVTEEDIKQEHFTIESRPPAPPAIDPAPRTVTVHAGDSRYQFGTAWPDTILTAAEKHGIRLPYSCRAGRCSTCVARLENGRVQMSINEVLTEKDLQQGLVLTCVGYAETDIALSF